MVNISSFIAYQASIRPDADAVLFEGQRISFGEFHERILTTAGWLQRQGIAPGTVVALLMKNSPAFLELAFAASHAGAVLLPINFRLSAAEVDYICANSEAKLLLCDEELMVTASSACPVVTLGSEAQRDSRKLGKAGAPGQLQRRSAGDLYRLMYTSGTTDHPKGVCHEYGNYHWKAAALAMGLDLSSQTRLLMAGPLYHVGAFDLPGITVLQFGGTLILHREFEPGRVLASIAEDRPNGAWLAPVMTGAVLDAARGHGGDRSSLRWTIAGGERTPIARVQAFCDAFPNARYIDAYGLTETCSGDTLMPEGFAFSRIGSAGKAVAFTELSIRNDDGEVLATGDEGEICVRGPKVFKRYWKAPEKTASSFFEDWFRTGDIGFLDEEGFLTITDRKKDMILSGGENIAASEIERVLQEHPAVSDAAVVGVPDPKWGERPVAHVVLAAGAAGDEAALLTHCREKLAGFKVPKSVVFRDDLPRNPSGKVLKRVLREEIAAG